MSEEIRKQFLAGSLSRFQGNKYSQAETTFWAAFLSKEKYKEKNSSKIGFANNQFDWCPALNDNLCNNNVQHI